MFYHVGDSHHTQNIRINKVIGESEKCIFYFTEKSKQTFWPTQYFVVRTRISRSVSAQWVNHGDQDSIYSLVPGQNRRAQNPDHPQGEKKEQQEAEKLEVDQEST